MWLNTGAQQKKPLQQKTSILWRWYFNSVVQHDRVWWADVLCRYFWSCVVCAENILLVLGVMDTGVGLTMLLWSLRVSDRSALVRVWAVTLFTNVRNTGKLHLDCIWICDSLRTMPEFRDCKWWRITWITRARKFVVNSRDNRTTTTS